MKIHQLHQRGAFSTCSNFIEDSAGTKTKPSSPSTQTCQEIQAFFEIPRDDKPPDILYKTRVNNRDKLPISTELSGSLPNLPV